MGRFTYRRARSGPVLAGLLLAVAIETVVLHLWLHPRVPAVAWALTVLSALSAVWLVGDHHAMGQRAVAVAPDALTLRIGWRMTARIARASVAGADRATWRDDPGSGAGRYANLMSPAEPNVIVRFAPAARIPLLGGLATRVDAVGLCVDEPDAFIAALTGPDSVGEPSTLRP